MNVEYVFLDMDGVIVDFVPTTLERLGFRPDDYDPKGQWDMEKVLGITVEEFWEAIDDIEFWSTLPKTEFFEPMMQLLRPYIEQKKVVLLSSPSRQSSPAAGKILWIEDNIPGMPYIFTSKKSLLATPNRVLIDDSDKNIDYWRKAGGIGIRLPRPWNKDYTIKRVWPTFMSRWNRCVADRFCEF